MSIGAKYAALTVKAGPYFLTANPLTACITKVFCLQDRNDLLHCGYVGVFCWALVPVLS